MRIALSIDTNQGLDSVLSHHFGRCPYFLLADVEGREVKKVEAVANPFFQQHEPGQVPGFIHEQGANVMITGGMGRRAITFFEQFNIEPVTGAFGTASQALEKYFGGGLQGAQACRESMEHAHHHHEAVPAGNVYEKDASGRLQEEAEALSKQMDEIQKRIKDLKSNP
jgi:predicted Fe-Mo cluster-binding NifX family protein